MSSNIKQEYLDRKYANTDDEVDTKYKKKSKKKTPKKANHKHDYKNCVIDFIYPKNYGLPKYNGKPGQALASYCPICGKLNIDVQEDKEVSKLFPHVAHGYFSFLFAQSARGMTQEEWANYRQWCNDNYPHFFIENYAVDKSPKFVDI